MTESMPGAVVVQAIKLSSQGREISWADSVVQRLEDRVEDVRRAIVAGTEAVAVGLDRLPSTPDWRISEISATFGVTLTADARVVVSRAGVEATFEVTVTLQRES